MIECIVSARLHRIVISVAIQWVIFHGVPIAEHRAMRDDSCAALFYGRGVAIASLHKGKRLHEAVAVGALRRG